MSLTDPTLAFAGATGGVAGVVIGTAAAMLADAFAPDEAVGRRRLPASRTCSAQSAVCCMVAQRHHCDLIPLVGTGLNFARLPMDMTPPRGHGGAATTGFEDHTPFVTRALQRIWGCLIGGAFALCCW
jgi:hypothetical protein